jgi:hypothetical protein
LGSEGYGHEAGSKEFLQWVVQLNLLIQTVYVFIMPQADWTFMTKML